MGESRVSVLTFRAPPLPAMHWKNPLSPHHNHMVLIITITTSPTPLREKQTFPSLSVEKLIFVPTLTPDFFSFSHQRPKAEVQ